MVEFDRKAFIGKFQEEASEYLQRLNEGVITLEGDPGNRELIEQMLRDAHTLKGSSRMVGLIEISDVAHRLEDIMVKVRDGEFVYAPDMSDFFFEALDMIVYLTDNAGVELPEPLDIASLTARLAALAEHGDAKAAAAAGAAEAPAPADAAAGPAAPQTPPAPEPAKTEQAAAVAGDAQAQVAEPPSASGRPQKEERLEAREQTTIRVQAAQLDTLLNLTSEVVISQIKSEQRAQDLRALQAEVGELRQLWTRVRAGLGVSSAADDTAEGLFEDVDALEGALTELRKRVAFLGKEFADDVSRASTVVADLQEHGMRLRMLPVSTIFDRFPRAMRDLAKQYNKEVDFVIEGADTELDKKVLEEINDPLIHIMRNAVDHGIESPDIREKAGKPRAGTIRLAARQEGDHIVVEISDDGAGIDPEAVRQAALRKGYITESEARNMSDREARYLIFESGFSTAQIITEISGRGVGMDVVRRFVVDKLKGSMDIESELGQGTMFRLRIPLTLAIIRALILRIGEHMFAMPTGSIEETLRVSADDILKVEGREVVRRQRRNIPIVRLGDVLGLTHADLDGAKRPVAIVGFSGHRMGFLVDSFVGEQQIVIKTLGTHLSKVENVAGVTILGAGEVVVILNVPELMSNARSLSGAHATQQAKEQRQGPRKILICEDSFTTRELERSIFEAAGYDVEVAMDGAMGLKRLREGLAPDAVVTDVQMPNMTGFELTKAIKTDARLKEIPVVIVTSLERDEEKAIGIEVGADAYITKSVFNQDTLLETVERLIR
ncbi:MAG TPA: hybrid sensor histidine kinase/response regulator [Coriobacteriia bacterium]